MPASWWPALALQPLPKLHQTERNFSSGVLKAEALQGPRGKGAGPVGFEGVGAISGAYLSPHLAVLHQVSSSLLRHPTSTRTMNLPSLQMRAPTVQQGLVFSLDSGLGVQCSSIFFLIPSSHPPKPPSLLSSKGSPGGGKHFLSIDDSRSSTENPLQQTCCKHMERLESPAGCTPLYIEGPSLRSSLLFPMPTLGEDGLITVLGARRGGLQDPSPVLPRLGHGWVWNR